MTVAEALPPIGCARPVALDMDARLSLILVAVGRDRDRGAFAEAFGVVAPGAKALYLARGAPPAVAEEIAHDAMEALWREAPGFDPAAGGGALAWVYALARDQWLRAEGRYLGRLAAEGAAVAGEAPASPWGAEGGAAEALARRDELLARVRAAMPRLPPLEVALLRDVFIRGLSHSAIARARRMPLGTVKGKIRKTLLALRAVAEGRDLP